MNDSRQHHGRTCDIAPASRRALILLALLLTPLACSSATSSGAFPWPLSSTRRRVLPGLRSAEVLRLSRGHDRMTSRAMIRRITRAVRANLDYAAYAGNPILHRGDPPAGVSIQPGQARLRKETLFGKAVVFSSIVSTIDETPLSKAERARPLAFEPLVNYLARWKADAAAHLEEVRSEVKEETWGLKKRPGTFFQAIAALYLHRAKGGATELWVKIEFSPWARLFTRMPDSDEDGYPEIFGRLRSGLVDAATVKRIRDDYQGRLLSTREVHLWANELASYWYPSHNTDVVTLGNAKVWPTEATDADVRKTLGKQTIADPTVVIRGKPLGKTIYNVFCIDGVAPLAAKVAAGGGASVGDGARKRYPVSADPRAIRDAIIGELRRYGKMKRIASLRPPPRSVIRRLEAAHEKAAWARWARDVAPLHRAIRRQLLKRPKKLSALLGREGFIFYRKSLDFVVGGDIQAQRAEKNPFQTIVAFKDYLARLGVDFLLVPVPTKSEVFPDKIRGVVVKKGAPLPILNPFARKLFLELSRAGVEIVDLLPAYLAARETKKASEEPLYQPQDTHWTDRGLRLAATILAERVKRYPWYGELKPKGGDFSQRRVTFTRYGDLHSRLTPKERRAFRPQKLIGHRVFDPRTQKPYDDDPTSPIVILGDSFTGVYERTYCESAGVSAHLARALRTPVDLVMSYGGGPNVRKKLLSRGEADLKRKRLVIWLFAARDLYNYWEAWKPLEKASK